MKPETLSLIWNYATVAVALIAGGYVIFRAAYVRALKETANGWKQSYEQKTEELKNIETRLVRLQTQFDSQERRHTEEMTALRAHNQQIIDLNVGLQLELKDKNTAIEVLKGKVNALEIQVKVLKGQPI